MTNTAAARAVVESHKTIVADSDPTSIYAQLVAAAEALVAFVEDGRR